MLGYKRRKKINPNDKNSKIDFTDQNGDKWQEFIVYHSKIKEWMKITGETNVEKSPWSGCCAEEINWINRVKLQAAAQKHVCHAISSTINLPEDVSEEKIAEIYETSFNSGVKGITVYRKNCRSGVMIDIKTPEKNEKCDSFRKRSKELECDIYNCSVKGEAFFVLVGKNKCGLPHEVFAGKNSKIAKHIDKGIIFKVKRGHYQLYDKNKNLLLDGITSYLTVPS